MEDLTDRKNAELLIENILKKYLDSKDVQRILNSVRLNQYCLPMRFVHYELFHLTKTKLKEDDVLIINKLMDIYG